MSVPTNYEASPTSDNTTPVLRAVGIADLAHRRASDLSGGQMRRVALAGLLASHPRAPDAPIGCVFKEAVRRKKDVKGSIRVNLQVAALEDADAPREARLSRLRC